MCLLSAKQRLGAMVDGCRLIPDGFLPATTQYHASYALYDYAACLAGKGIGDLPTSRADDFRRSSYPIFTNCRTYRRPALL